MGKKRVLFISSEIMPYLPETDMSYIGRFLPQGIQDKGKEIRTFMPRFGCINDRRNQLHEVIRLSGMNLIINDADHPLIIKVASIQSARMQVYFIDNEDYFHHRHMTRDENGNFYKDNDERSIFFAKGVFETVKKLGWAPDLVYCQGWFTASVPILLKKDYSDDPIFSKAKVVYSTADDLFDNTLDVNFNKKLISENICEDDVDVISIPNYNNVNKLAFNYSDGVIFNTPNLDPALRQYVDEIGKPFIEYSTRADYVSIYDKFFNSIMV
ncbi:MAG: glycogen/starch synthase [Culturomica sp.]|jgi:starch synthase|nr:glycogen/starch synthase [Culturomica sp.]